MSDRQHVWVGPEATSFEIPCEACMARRDGWPDTDGLRVAPRGAMIVGAPEIPAPASTAVAASEVSLDTGRPRRTRARSAAMSSAVW